MKSDLEVDADAVRGCAAAVGDTGARVAAGAGRAPTAATVPRWSSTDTATALSDAALRAAQAFGSGLSIAGREIRATADDYDAADDRAARRLGTAR